MKVIWYNTMLEAYQFGTYIQYQKVARTEPHNILALERLINTPEKTIVKVVSELNKCRNRMSA